MATCAYCEASYAGDEVPGHGCPACDGRPPEGSTDRATGEALDEERPDFWDPGDDEDEDWQAVPTSDGLLGPVLTVEVGLELAPLVDPAQGGDLLDRLAPLRASLVAELGWILPSVLIRERIDLPPCGYRILLHGSPIGRQALCLDHQLALARADTEPDPPLVGIAAPHPADPLARALWVTGAEAQLAAAQGYHMLDPASALLAHVEALVRRHAGEILSRQDVSVLLERIGDAARATVDELVPRRLPLSTVHQVLQRLLREGVAIRPLDRLLERLSDLAVRHQDPTVLAEYLRTSLALPLCAALADENGLLCAVRPDAELTRYLTAAIAEGPLGPELALPISERETIASALVGACQRARSGDRRAIVVTDPPLRPLLFTLLAPTIPTVAVLVEREIHADYTLVIRERVARPTSL